MSLPQKKRGFRKIIVAEREFNWRLNTQIEVCPASNKANKLLVDVGWVDPFLHMSDMPASLSDDAPQKITPALVRKAIELALSQHWNPDGEAGITKIKSPAWQ